MVTSYTITTSISKPAIRILTRTKKTTKARRTRRGQIKRIKQQPEEQQQETRRNDSTNNKIRIMHLSTHTTTTTTKTKIAVQKHPPPPRNLLNTQKNTDDPENADWELPSKERKCSHGDASPRASTQPPNKEKLEYRFCAARTP